jgi:hypothetical protein
MPNLDDFLSRIQTDHTFYLQFRQNPEEALSGYELSAEERTVLAESPEQLRPRLGEPNSYWKLSCNYALLGSGERELTPVTAISRPEVQGSLSQIRKTNGYADRLALILALMEQIG